jgi:RNA polymerase sigma-70 factor (ECF subfamily)
MPPFDEERVVSRCLEGDLAAYRELYERFEQPLLRTAFRMLHRMEDAEDAVQEAFLRLFRGIQGYKKGSRFSTYLFRILINSCFDLLRKRQKSLAFTEADLEKLPAPAVRAAEHNLERIIDRLPVRMRTCFVLFAVEEFSQEEIAAMLSISVGSVKTNVHRARQKLQAWLAAAPGEEGA